MFEYKKKSNPTLIYLGSKLIIEEEQHTERVEHGSRVSKGARDMVTASSFGDKSPLRLRLTKAGFVGFCKAMNWWTASEQLQTLLDELLHQPVRIEDRHGCILMLPPAGNI